MKAGFSHMPVKFYRYGHLRKFIDFFAASFYIIFLLILYIELNRTIQIYDWMLLGLVGIKIVFLLLNKTTKYDIVLDFIIFLIFCVALGVFFTNYKMAFVIGQPFFWLGFIFFIKMIFPPGWCNVYDDKIEIIERYKKTKIITLADIDHAFNFTLFYGEYEEDKEDLSFLLLQEKGGNHFQEAVRYVFRYNSYIGPSNFLNFITDLLARHNIPIYPISTEEEKLWYQENILKLDNKEEDISSWPRWKRAVYKVAVWIDKVDQKFSRKKTANPRT